MDQNKDEKQGKTAPANRPLFEILKANQQQAQANSKFQQQLHPSILLESLINP
jgi:hypothetical protein